MANRLHGDSSQKPNRQGRPTASSLQCYLLSPVLVSDSVRQPQSLNGEDHCRHLAMGTMGTSARQKILVLNGKQALYQFLYQNDSVHVSRWEMMGQVQLSKSEAGGFSNNMLSGEFQLNMAQQHAPHPPIPRTSTATLVQPARNAVAISCDDSRLHDLYVGTFKPCFHMLFRTLLRLLISEGQFAVASMGQKCLLDWTKQYRACVCIYVCACVKLGYQQTGSCSRTMESLGYHIWNPLSMDFCSTRCLKLR